MELLQYLYSLLIGSLTPNIYTREKMTVCLLTTYKEKASYWAL